MKYPKAAEWLVSGLERLEHNLGNYRGQIADLQARVQQYQGDIGQLEQRVRDAEEKATEYRGALAKLET